MSAAAGLNVPVAIPVQPAAAAPGLVAPLTAQAGREVTSNAQREVRRPSGNWSGVEVYDNGTQAIQADWIRAVPSRPPITTALQPTGWASAAVFVAP